MKISIFGLGYVGAVTAACLSQQGHSIVGVDVSAQKVAALNRGEAPIIEPGLEQLLAQARDKGLLRATTDVHEAVSTTDLSLICVGTPSAISGAIDFRFVRQVTAQVAESLKRLRTKRHFLVFRSTMLPGSTASLVEDCLAHLLEEKRLEVFYYPEFLREGTAVDDFLNPSLSVVGSHHATPPPQELTTLFFGSSNVVDWKTAEMVKYVCNAFHATKITFANEMGRLSKEMGVNAASVMSLMCQDTKLNLSPYYLKPGNPFGGSCLPKDVRALAHAARQHGISLPLLDNLLPSNEQHLQSLLQLIEKSRQSEVIILGLSFKSNTDDLRESAMVEVAQVLLGKGYKLRIFDPQLNLAQLVGSNKRLIDTKMPHLASLLQTNLPEAIGQAGLVLAAQNCVSIADLAACITRNHHVVDINGWNDLKQLPSSYEGFCW